MQPLLPIVIGLALLLPGATSRAWAATLDASLSRVLTTADDDTEIPVIVTLNNQVAPSRFRHLAAGRQRLNALIMALRRQTDESQRGLRLFLQTAGVRKSKPLWTINGLAFRARPELLEALAARPEVAEIRLDGTIPASSPIPGAVTGNEWNIEAVGAPLLWNQGLTGSGVVVASLDTGVDWLHPDLAGNYRGGPGAWFDPYDEHPAPYDSDPFGHGTAVMGVMIGGGDSGSAIGMAPAAQWIAAKIFSDTGAASYSAIHQAYAWALDPDGDGDGIDAPRVLNNSWGLDAVNQCSDEFQPDIVLLKEAGIITIFSAGNINAPATPSTSSSPANYPESMAVGATDRSGLIASFSARGPSACPGGDQLYPQVSAPGVHILSADRTLVGTNPDPYQIGDGTSFAAPHVSGLMALLLGANGFPAALPAVLEETLEKSADDLGSPGPDNTYGYGLINSLAAYRRLRGEPHLAVYDPQPPEHDRQLDFGSLPLGTTVSRSLTLRNSGAGLLVFANHDWSGLDPAFSVVDLCSGQALAADQTCQLTVSFAPAAAIAYAATLNLSTSDPDYSPQLVSLSGSGSNDSTQPVLQVDPAGLTVDFGAVPPGATSQRTLILANAGGGILTIDPIDFSAIAAPFALVSDGCGTATLTADESCTVLFSFSPALLQNYQTRVTITSDDPANSSLTVTLSGNGNHPPIAATLAYPANGATVLATGLTLRWLPGSDPDGDMLSEEVVLTPPSPATAGLPAGSGAMGGGAIMLLLAGSLLFHRRPRSLPAPLRVALSAGLIFLAACGGGGSAAPASVSYSTYTPANLVANTTYNWKVVTTDSRGASTESATWQFTTR